MRDVILWCFFFYQKNDWNNVELMFDGVELFVRVRVVGKDKQVLEFKNFIVFIGKLVSCYGQGDKL